LVKTKEMKKKSSIIFLYLGVLTITVAILWTYISVFKKLKKTEKPILSPQEMDILNPSLDEEIFQKIESKQGS